MDMSIGDKWMSVTNKLFNRCSNVTLDIGVLVSICFMDLNIDIMSLWTLESGLIFYEKKLPFKFLNSVFFSIIDCIFITDGSFFNTSKLKWSLCI
jgi:hypothetical protein